METNFPFPDDQLAFAFAVREVLAENCPAAAVREAGRALRREGRLPAWPQLADLGFFGMLVPEEHDGLGRGLAGSILAFEETGRAALPGPVVETAVVAPLLVRDGDLLGQLAAGKLCVSARLGDQVHAPDADLADLLVLERHGETEVVPAAEVRLTPQAGADPVRRLFSVAVGEGERGPAETARPSTGHPSTDRFSTARPSAGRSLMAASALASAGATVAVAGQLVGLARHVLEVSAEHAASRRRSGLPTPAFHAVTRRLADVATAIDLAAPLVYTAAAVVDQVARGAVEPSGLGRVVSAAKASAGEAATRAAETALRVYGSAGYAEEPALPLWLARVWSLASAYGDTGVHRARLRAAALGDSALVSGLPREL
ncbi:acyl-CoA dehydrogenase family protein [Planotetraspora kaengkrachanensis]|uniref:Acyl-CoA dehydrogenase n=1 Tax=Planotetraspora kaengkrachanensis TaxID=575193 RepID=A0A8J3M4K5_9ACTN|nr:acyl-CoA dehydrogenase family protein [Planotetraspora kaengkrachanensis]GIG79344.1 acyl-CoA dehydrogenase [Planotetraspora kaengkrachanensis]